MYIGSTLGYVEHQGKLTTLLLWTRLRLQKQRARESTAMLRTGPRILKILEIDTYSRLKKVGTWMKDDLCWFSFFLWFGIGGRSCYNLMAHTIRDTSCDGLQSLQVPGMDTEGKNC